MKYGNEQIEAPKIANGTRQPINLVKDGIWHSMLIVISGVFSVTGGTGIGTIHADALFRYLKGLLINAGGGPMQNWDGRWLNIISRIFYPAQFQQTPPTSLAAGSSEAVEAVFEVPFFMPFSLAPDQFAFPVQFASNPNVVAEYGNASDLATGADGVLALEDLAIEFRKRDLIDAPMNPGGYAALVVRTQSLDVLQDASEKRVELEGIAPGMEIRAVLLRAEVDGELNDSLVTAAELQIDGKPVYHRTTFGLIQNVNKKAYQLDSKETGVAVIDSAEDQRTGPGDLFNVNTPIQPVLKLGLAKQAGTCTVEVLVIATDRRNARRAA